MRSFSVVSKTRTAATTRIHKLIRFVQYSEVFQRRTGNPKKAILHISLYFMLKAFLFVLLVFAISCALFDTAIRIVPLNKWSITVVYKTKSMLIENAIDYEHNYGMQWLVHRTYYEWLWNWKFGSISHEKCTKCHTDIA